MSQESDLGLPISSEALAAPETEYFSHMRHELRTPVNAILGYSEILLEDAESDGHEGYLPDLRRINNAGRKLLTLIGELKMPETTFAAAPDAPIEHAPASSQTTLDAPHESLTFEALSGSHLLIVDDNETNRELLSRRLVRQGHTFGMAENGREALEKLRAESYDLVLLDIMMPEMDGYETLQVVKADPALRHIPVIMLSALTEMDSIVRCIEMGAEDYLPKPFDATLLRARIGASLVKKRFHDQEMAYMRDAIRVTEAAAALEKGEFVPGMLTSVSVRNDSLGHMAQMFEKMAAEVQAREQRLKQQVQQLTIQIDEKRKEREVAEITETDYFQQLQQRASNMRRRERTSA